MNYSVQRTIYRIICAAVVLLLYACSGEPETGPKQVKWDRDACERCRMVLSDRKHSAQVRWVPPGERSQVLFFDDIGCATIWLEDKPWRDDPTTEIWVTDYRDGKWIDARKATYIKGQITPMEYELSAQSDPDPNGLNFEQAKQHVKQVEERFDARGVQLLEQLKRQAERRQEQRAKKREQGHQ
jgi:copper chaperone NosL